MNEASRQRIIVPALRLAGGILRLVFSTCRMEIINEEVHRRYILGEESIIGATWHRGALFFIYFFGAVHPTMLLSRSRDGEYLAGFAEDMGVKVVRGSSSRGGAAALYAMIKMLRKERGKYATVVDGPRGPRYSAKPGLVALAQKTGVPILPVVWSGTHVFTFKKSWDRTILPLPFSTIRIAYGMPIYVPSDGHKSVIESYTRMLQEELLRLTRHVDELCGYAGGA